TNAGGGTLSGTTTVAASGGIATFSTLSIDKVGTGYTLAATDGSLGAGTSAFFNITPAAAVHLAFSVQPSNAIAGQAINPAVTVRVLDPSGNLVTPSSSSVPVALAATPAAARSAGPQPYRRSRASPVSAPCPSTKWAPATP